MKSDIINSSLIWFNKELKILLDKIQHAKTYKDYGDFNWPLHTKQYLKEDLIQTANMFSRHYKDKNTSCCLNNLEEFLNPDKSLDYFFMRLHIIGHIILDQIVSFLDSEDMEDIAFSEIVCLYFATLATHHFYNIEHFTPNMALQIAQCMYDEITIVKGKPCKYTALDKINTVTVLFNTLLDIEKLVLQ